LDHPGLGTNKPSFLRDQLNTLQPSSMEEIQKVLFLRKMPAYIRDMVNLQERCNKIWETRSQDIGAPSPYCSSSNSAVASAPLPLAAHHHSVAKALLPANPATAGCPHPAPSVAAAATATATTPPASDRMPRSARTAAHTRKTRRRAVAVGIPLFYHLFFFRKTFNSTSYLQQLSLLYLAWIF
jgi:hypothetical protein